MKMYVWLLVEQLKYITVYNTGTNFEQLKIYYTGVPEKSLMIWSKGCVCEIKRYFWYIFSLNKYSSSPEIEAFYVM